MQSTLLAHSSALYYNSDCDYEQTNLRDVNHKSAAINPFTLHYKHQHKNDLRIYSKNNSVDIVVDNINANINNIDGSDNHWHNVMPNNTSKFNNSNSNRNSNVIRALEQTKVERWISHIHETLQTHRSVFVAAEIILQELQKVKDEVVNPIALCLSTVLTVLQFCIPRLGKEQRGIINAAIEELIPIITFSEMEPTNLSFASNANYTEVPNTQNICMSNKIKANECKCNNRMSVQRTYAECFHTVFAHYTEYMHASKVYKRREVIEALVMERVVRALDVLWVKLCFKAWRVHNAELRAIKPRFRQLMERGMAANTLPYFIFKWRQHAHTRILHEKLARLSEVNKVLKSLEPVYQSVHAQRDRLSNEIREKMHHLEMSEKEVRECAERFHALILLCNETNCSYQEHRSCWRECVQMLFHDALTRNEKWRNAETEVRTGNGFITNITDTAALFMSRARARIDRVGVIQLWKLLERNQITTVSICNTNSNDHNNNNDISKGSNNNTLLSDENRYVETSRNANHNVHMNEQFHQACSLQYSCDENVMCSAVINKITERCSPVVSTLTIRDVVSDNQQKMKLTYQFLECIFSGGYCSLFNHLMCKNNHFNISNNSETNKINHYDKKENNKANNNNNSDDNIDDDDDRCFEKDCCTAMIEQITNGVETLQHCKDVHDEYLMNIHRCMSGNGLERVQDMLRTFCIEWSRLGKPLDRTRVEHALIHVVSSQDEPILHAFYPSSEISNELELIHYLSSAAEFANWPLISVVEQFTTQYTFNIDEELQLEFTSRQITHFFRHNSDSVKLFCEKVKDDNQVAKLSHEKLEECMVKYVNLSYDEFDILVSEVNKKYEYTSKTLEPDCLEFLIFMTAKMQDPSPFSTIIDKLFTTMRKCLLYKL